MTLLLSAQAELEFRALGDLSNFDSRVLALLEENYPKSEPSYESFVEHSYQVAGASVALAELVGADVGFVREASWLHDLGIKFTHAPGIGCHGTQPYLRHGLIGQELCRAKGLDKHGLVCLRHVGTGLTAEEIRAQNLPLPALDCLCQSLEERLICYVDQFYSKSRSEPLSLDEVRRRNQHFGPNSLARFEAFFEEFGVFWPTVISTA